MTGQIFPRLTELLLQATNFCRVYKAICVDGFPVRIFSGSYDVRDALIASFASKPEKKNRFVFFL